MPRTGSDAGADRHAHQLTGRRRRAYTLTDSRPSKPREARDTPRRVRPPGPVPPLGRAAGGRTDVSRARAEPADVEGEEGAGQGGL